MSTRTRALSGDAAVVELTENTRGVMSRLAPWARPDIVVALLAAAVVGIRTYIRTGRLEFVDSSILLPVAVLVLVAAMAVLEHFGLGRRSGNLSTMTLGRRLSRGFQSWGVLALMVFVYENLRSAIDFTGAKEVTDWLYRADVWIFGVEPTVWLQKLYHPLLVDVMAFFYILYFALPVLLMLLWYFSGEESAFEHLGLSMVLAMFLGYLGYVFVPASPPRFAIAHMYTHPVHLEGYFVQAKMQAIWDTAATAARYCAFPSLHVGLSSLAVVWGFAFYRKVPARRIVMPLVSVSAAALWFATLYLRHHWFVDVLGGFATAGLASLGSLLVLNWLRSKQAPGALVEN